VVGFVRQSRSDWRWLSRGAVFQEEALRMFEGGSHRQCNKTLVFFLIYGSTIV
jgi:hypothetical protein